MANNPLESHHYETISVTLIEDGAVLSIVLNQPKANVLTMAMMAELLDLFALYRQHLALKLVILSGAGRHFSFGASVSEHQRGSAKEMLVTFHSLVRAIAAYPVPIAALVLGKCLGGAFELVLACHFVFASPSAIFACPEVRLGVIPPVLCVLGHHRLGGPLAERMILTGQELNALHANTNGLVTQLLPDEANHHDLILGWYRETLAPLSTFSLREATYAARAGSGMLTSLGTPLDAAEHRYIDRLLPSHDGNEGIQAFLEKRAPAWVGT